MKKHQTSKLPILFYDIETHLAQGYFFDRKNEVSVDNVIKQPGIISIAWMWEGDKKAQVRTVADFPATFKRDPYNDKLLLKEFRKELVKAQYVVGHYNTGFDDKYVAYRMFANKLPPMPEFVALDTYRGAANKFKTVSNRLSSLGIARGLGGKIQTNAELWRRCARGEKKAIKEMGEYNRRDVELLYALYYELSPHIKNKLNRALHDVGKQLACPTCGGTHLQRRGALSTGFTIKQRYECRGCGKWFTRALKKGQVVHG